MPHDAVVPGVLALGDVCDIVTTLAPRAVRIENAVTGLNRSVSEDDLESVLSDAVAAYRDVDARGNLSLHGRADGRSAARWLLSALVESQDEENDD